MIPKASAREAPAQALERAYSMALGVEAAARQRLGDGDPAFVDLMQWLLAAELLGLLDELRAGLVAPLDPRS